MRNKKSGRTWTLRKRYVMKSSPFSSGAEGPVNGGGSRPQEALFVRLVPTLNSVYAGFVLDVHTEMKDVAHASQLREVGKRTGD